MKMLGLSLRELTASENQEPFIPREEQFIFKRQSLNNLDLQTLTTYIHHGFFPALYEKDDQLVDWDGFYSSYFRTYLDKDIRGLHNITDETAFVRFVQATAGMTGQSLDLLTISSICGKKINKVKSWLSILESSGLVYLLPPYYNNQNKLSVRTPKLYFLDSGLACWLLGYNTPEQLSKGAMWGSIFESFVFSEILKSYYNNGIIYPPLFCYRDQEKNEIDILISEGDTLYPLEIKTTSDPSKSMVNAFKQLDNISGKKRGIGVLLCLADRVLPLQEKVWIMPVSAI